MQDKGSCSGEDDDGVNRFLVAFALLLAGFLITWAVLLQKVLYVCKPGFTFSDNVNPGLQSGF